MDIPAKHFFILQIDKKSIKIFLNKTETTTKKIFVTELNLELSFTGNTHQRVKLID
jgi:sucrose-6-phosphate hydrolase SacC (GH32 family)